MIDRTHTLPVARQCQLLQLARSTAYYQPRLVSDTTLALMRLINELHLQYPFAGARPSRRRTSRSIRGVGRRQVATLMRWMGITSIYRMPRTSRPDLPVSTAPTDHHAAESRLGSLYYVYSDAPRLRAFMRDPRRGKPSGVGLAAVQHVYHGLLCGCRAGGQHPVWLPGAFQHRSRLPVHGRGIHWIPERPRDSDQYGWDGAVAG